MEVDGLRQRQGPLGAHQQVRGIDGPVIRIPGCPGRRTVQAGHQRVNVVAADPPEHVREPGPDLALLPSPQCHQGLPEGIPFRFRQGQRSEAAACAVGQDGVDGVHVVPHQAVAQGPAAAGVVGGHAPDGRPRGGGDVHGKPDTPGFQHPVQLVEHDARQDPAAEGFHVQVDDVVEVLGVVDHQPPAHGLAALGRAAAPGQHRDAVPAGEVKGGLHVFRMLRNHHTEGHHLVDGGVGGIASAVEYAGQQLPTEIAGERVEGQ